MGNLINYSIRDTNNIFVPTEPNLLKALKLIETQNFKFKIGIDEEKSKLCILPDIGDTKSAFKHLVYKNGYGLKEIIIRNINNELPRPATLNISFNLYDNRVVNKTFKIDQKSNIQNPQKIYDGGDQGLTEGNYILLSGLETILQTNYQASNTVTLCSIDKSEKPNYICHLETDPFVYLLHNYKESFKKWKQENKDIIEADDSIWKYPGSDKTKQVIIHKDTCIAFQKYLKDQIFSKIYTIKGDTFQITLTYTDEDEKEIIKQIIDNSMYDEKTKHRWIVNGPHILMFVIELVLFKVNENSKLNMSVNNIPSIILNK